MLSTRGPGEGEGVIQPRDPPLRVRRGAVSPLAVRLKTLTALLVAANSSLFVRSRASLERLFSPFAPQGQGSGWGRCRRSPPGCRR
jgi:hypothetical protein